jgi:hypothetical protein
MGRIHLGVQNLGDLQTRKTKALKRGRDPNMEDKVEMNDLGPDQGLDMVQSKKPRVS